MTVANSTVKKTAREALKNNKIKVFAVCSEVLVCYLINLNISSCLYIIGGNIFANTFFVILNFFMFFPILLGSLRFFWRMFCGVCDNPISVFYYFTSKDNYKKALSLSFKIAIKALIVGVLLSIPYFAVSIISSVKTYDFLNVTIPLWTANLANLTVFLKSLAIIGTIFSILKYYLAPMLMVVDENMEVNEAIHMSVVISKRTTLDFVSLFFSMIGWILLSLLFIPLLYTLPLFIMVYLTHCSFAVGEYNEHISKLNAQGFPNFMAGV